MRDRIRKLLLIAAAMLTFFAAFISLIGMSSGKAEVEARADIKASTVEIEGPGAVSEFSPDGYWWPGKVVEKTIIVKNVGQSPFNLTSSASGSAAEGANALIKVTFVYTKDNGRNDHHGNIHLAPGETQEVKIRAEFNPAAGNSYQGNSWNVVFTFFAKQCDYYEK